MTKSDRRLFSLRLTALADCGPSRQTSTIWQRRIAVLATFGLSIAGLLCQAVGCRPAPPASAPPPNPPTTEVIAVEATTRKIVDYREFTGRTAAVNSVEIRARVSGYLLQSPRSTTENSPKPPASSLPQSELNVTVDEGSLVQKDDLLFVIDPRPYELALEQSKGSLQAAEARLQQANQDLTRSNALLEKNATSRADYDSAVAAVAELRGQIENLKATVARNQLDLEFTRVRSPIDGLLGRTLITDGNLVSADFTILTTVVSVDPVYVDFDVDEQSVLDYRTRMLDGQVKSARDTQIPIRLGLANEEGFPHEGTIDFVNNTTDPKTGNTRIRGLFNNVSGILSPGLFARIQVPFTAEYDAVLIPTTAIGMDQQGRYVMVVDAQNKVARRSVKLGDIVDTMVVVREGVKPGEQVVTSGLQKIRPGSQVQISAGGSR